MSNRTIIFLVLCALAIHLNAQTVYLTENEKNIYWQPNATINFSDYQAKTDTCVKYNKKYGLQMSSNIGFRGVVDVPSKKRMKVFDKFYLAPVFCKNCSCILSEDTLELKVDRLVFDIAEVCVRNARKELLELQSKINADNTYTMFFTSIRNKWEENMRKFIGSAFGEILIEKKDNAYVEWRQMIDEFLQQTEQYATRPEDCYRFILGKPIEKGYKMAKTVAGDMRNKN